MILFVSRLLKFVPGGIVAGSVVKAISRMKVADQTRLLFGKITSSIPTNGGFRLKLNFHSLF